MKIKVGDKVLFSYQHGTRIAQVSRVDGTIIYFSSGGILGTTIKTILEVYTKETHPEEFL